MYMSLKTVLYVQRSIHGTKINGIYSLLTCIELHTGITNNYFFNALSQSHFLLFGLA